MPEATTAAPVVSTFPPPEGDDAPEVTPAPAPEGGAPEAVKEAKKEAARLHKLKLDGEEVEVDDDELKRGYQLSKTGYKRLEEASVLRKQVEGFIAGFQSDPVATLRQLAGGAGPQGKAFRDAVEKYLYEEMSREQWSPEKKALYDAEQRLAATERERTALTEQRKREVFQQQQAHWAQKYEADISAAISAPDVGLPKTPSVVRRMAELMSKSLKLGLEVDPHDVAKLVKREFLDAQKEVLSGLDGAALMKLLGPELAKKIRQHEVAQLKTRPGEGTDAPTKAPARPAPDAPKRAVMRERDFDAFVRDRARGS